MVLGRRDPVAALRRNARWGAHAGGHGAKQRLCQVAEPLPSSGDGPTEQPEVCNEERKGRQLRSGSERNEKKRPSHRHGRQQCSLAASAVHVPDPGHIPHQRMVANGQQRWTGARGRGRGAALGLPVRVDGVAVPLNDRHLVDENKRGVQAAATPHCRHRVTVALSHQTKLRQNERANVRRRRRGRIRTDGAS